ncbi:two-component response regulator ARR14-like isoform X3 [Mercurialis annua]|uniref:two-component response regulator ARR14-like isoform X3 n=1 Tax=Mercurialis annua TaxID=3986 RepID=UPI00215FF414|nr:two-component response regulator ARR14-like isoform X3 [Mercurialis annua]
METNNNGKGIIEASSIHSHGHGKLSDFISGEFPTGLRVLVVDDDRTCLTILGRMLKVCLYKVTTCLKSKDALVMLRDEKNNFDILVIDLHMPDIDGFKLLQVAEVELDLPVVLMSSDDDHEIVKKGVIDGACDYLIKPIRMEALRMIWQHVVRRKKDSAKEEFGQMMNLKDCSSNLLLTKPDGGGDDDKTPANTRDAKSSKRRKINKDDDGVGEASDPAATGKKRMIWTDELHEKFVRAVKHLGESAVPLKILECLQQMNVHDITREHIASHLQYRIHLRKQDETPQQKQELFMPSRINRPFISEQSPSLENLQLFANRHSTRQYPLPSIADAQAGLRVPLNVISNIGPPFSDPGRQFVHSGMVEPSYYPMAQPSANNYQFNGNFDAGSSCKTLSYISYGKEYDCRNKENIAQITQNFAARNSFDELHGDTTPQLIYEPPLYLQQFEQNEIYHGPFIQQQEEEPPQIKYNNATQFDKSDFQKPQ